MFPHLLPVLLAFLLAGAVSFYTFANEEEPLKLTKTNPAPTQTSGKAPSGSVARGQNQKAIQPARPASRNLSETGVVAHEDLDESLREAKTSGYRIWKITGVKGNFAGCASGANIIFENGMRLTCSETEKEETQAHPAVVIMKNIDTGFYKVFIANEEYPGTLHGVF
ncbi:MAG: hypothetical protein VKJ04_08220 [Vampirovibrionales bacterium]|nr:hypothetical protein [Vampirovibrionales bacterium]